MKEKFFNLINVQNVQIILKSQYTFYQMHNNAENEAKMTIIAKCQGSPDFVENVLGSFSCFIIEFAYSNFTFCGT